jgi:carboxymethylenebutenolidase|tara:strand:+ start:2671 stop:3003 length:333 start_codon:yes stop_codon:yes gene_type:complete
LHHLRHFGVGHFLLGGIGAALGGGPSPLGQTANIGCPMLGLFGEEDVNPTPEDVANFDEELTKNGKTHEFHSYAGAGHGFHCEARASYQPEAAADASANVAPHSVAVLPW